jgi:hypothetical protein
MTTIHHQFIDGLTAAAHGRANAVEESPMKYRIETTGDGAGAWEVVGWSEVVNAVAENLYSEPTPDQYIEAHEMLMEGIDDADGWDGKSVRLMFEDGTITVTLIGPVDSPASAIAAGQTAGVRQGRIAALTEQMAELDREIDALIDKRDALQAERSKLIGESAADQTQGIIRAIVAGPPQMQAIGDCFRKGMADVARADEAEPFEQQ